MEAGWSGVDVRAQLHLTRRCSDSFQESKLDHVETGVLSIQCLPGGSLASHRRKDTRRAAEASHLGEGTVPLVLGPWHGEDPQGWRG